jgi:hypothetical protein
MIDRHTFAAWADEFEKIATSEELTLKSSPWDLGIHAKRTGDRNRGLAYPHGVGGAALGGAAVGGAVGAVTGGPILARLGTSKGRTKMLSEMGEDAATLSGEALKAKAQAAKRGARGALKAGKGDAAAKGGRAIGRSLAESLKSPKVHEMIGRRLKGASKAALAAGTFAVGAKLLSNIGKYEYAKKVA